MADAVKRMEADAGRTTRLVNLTDATGFPNGNLGNNLSPEPFQPNLAQTNYIVTLMWHLRASSRQPRGATVVILTKRPKTNGFGIVDDGG